MLAIPAIAALRLSLPRRLLTLWRAQQLFPPLPAPKPKPSSTTPASEYPSSSLIPDSPAPVPNSPGPAPTADSTPAYRFPQAIDPPQRARQYLPAIVSNSRLPAHKSKPPTRVSPPLVAPTHRSAARESATSPTPWVLQAPAYLATQRRVASFAGPSRPQTQSPPPPQKPMQLSTARSRG